MRDDSSPLTLERSSHVSVQLTLFRSKPDKRASCVDGDELPNSMITARSVMRGLHRCRILVVRTGSVYLTSLG